MTEIKKQALGKGLAALIGSTNEAREYGSNSNSDMLPLYQIIPGKHQPRTTFIKEELEALAQSIKEKGVLQPIIVRPSSADGHKYEIVAGERRWRAAKLSGLDQIPAIIKKFTEAEALEVGLLENIQRQDLNPIEEAEGYKKLAEEFSHTQESLSKILGKSRSHIANTMRLLTLSPKIKDYIKEGKLSAGHGRALLSSSNPDQLAEQIINQNLSVREVEGQAKGRISRKADNQAYTQGDPELSILKNHLFELIGKKVELQMKGRGGNIIIPFKDPSDLDLIIQKLNNASS